MLNQAFMLQFCLSSGMGVLMLFFPDDLRDYFCDNTVRKCEKLSGCGVGAALSGILALSLLSQGYLAYSARTLKDALARSAVAKVIALQHAVVLLYVAKDISMHIWNDAAWVLVVSMAVMCAAFIFLLSRGDPEHLELRSRAEV